MNQTNPKNEITLEIESLSYGPYGVARYDGQVIMIPATVPGDKVTARLVRKKGNYAIGEVIRVTEAAPDRQTPPCPYVSECGGCPWQQVQYKTQLRAKQKSIEDALRRIGKLDEFQVCPIISSANEFHYRRRVRLHVDKSKRLGFYHPGSHRLVEIGYCLIAGKEADGCIEALRKWVKSIHASIEQIEIVTGDQPDETIIVAKATGEFVADDEDTCGGLLTGEPRIRGLIVCGREWRRTWGETRISVDTEERIRLMVEADVFTQVNPQGNRRIMSELLIAGEFAAGDRVLELYCGAGNFTLSIAKRVQKVVAVEGHRPSIESGKRSAQLNGIDNIHWISESVTKALERFGRRERFTKIVLDPPRTGAKGIGRRLASFGAAKILYVSCNPTTLARDASELAKQGYKLAIVQPIDLFPHTFHVEVVATLIR
ncbi:MAG: 23S rRNA (uracil(1939)-C(5))-methyltransferase RlmD [Candidatus Binatia bacterium]